MKRREEKKESRYGLFFLRARAGHTLLAVPGRIFAAVRCN
jgi:hypothetical protein